MDSLFVKYIEQMDAEENLFYIDSFDDKLSEKYYYNCDITSEFNEWEKFDEENGIVNIFYNMVKFFWNECYLLFLHQGTCKENSFEELFNTNKEYFPNITKQYNEIFYRDEEKPYYYHLIKLPRLFSLNDIRENLPDKKMTFQALFRYFMYLHDIARELTDEKYYFIIGIFRINTDYIVKLEDGLNKFHDLLEEFLGEHLKYIQAPQEID